MNTNLDDILTLLALAVMADKKVLQTEVDTFLIEAATIPKDLGVDAKYIDTSATLLPQSKLIAWLYENNDRLKSMMKAQSFERTLLLLTTRLNWLSDKQVILRKMMVISAADSDFHVSEKALVTLVARYWSEPIPNL